MWVRKCTESYYGESARHLTPRSKEHIGIALLTNEKVQLEKHCHHSLIILQLLNFLKNVYEDYNETKDARYFNIHDNF